jgi:hypothetical protein
MKAKVYYQDFSLNSGIFCKEGLVVDRAKSVFIIEVESPLEREQIVDSVYRDLNLNPVVTVGLENKGRFAEAEHTSMSIGDFVQFPDGEYWICASAGWEVRK